METYKKIGIGVLVVVFAIIGGFSAGWLAPNNSELPDSFDIAKYINLDDIKGERGLTGLRGPIGPIGLTGKIGKSGIGGKDASINIKKLTDSVVDEIEKRATAIVIDFNGESGDSTLNFEIETAGTYKVTLRHSGAGDFVVSYTDKDDNLYSIIDTEGHIITSKTIDLGISEYTLLVSADGDWSVELKEN